MSNELVLLQPEEFFPSPEQTTAVADVRRHFAPGGVVDIDPVVVRAGEDWSYLAGQVVGAEE